MLILILLNLMKINGSYYKRNSVQGGGAFTSITVKLAPPPPPHTVANPEFTRVN